MGKEQFSTKDLNLAAAISVLAGVEPVLSVDHSGRVVFDFPPEDGIYKVVAEYHSAEASASLLDYTEKLRSLRAAMFAKRGAVR